jgi:hypothetical protein
MSESHKHIPPDLLLSQVAFEDRLSNAVDAVEGTYGSPPGRSQPEFLKFRTVVRDWKPSRCAIPSCRGTVDLRGE